MTLEDLSPMVIANLCVLVGLAIFIAQERVCIPTGTRTLE